jgi:hypothetical protein
LLGGKQRLLLGVGEPLHTANRIVRYITIVLAPREYRTEKAQGARQRALAAPNDRAGGPSF